MILTFTTKDGVDYISHEFGRPMVQAEGGCRIMYDTALKIGGLSISDGFMPGWSKECHWDGNYFHPKTKEYGSHGMGRIDVDVIAALGFKIKSKHLCWSSGYGLETMTAEEINKFYNKGGGQKAADALRPKGIMV